MNTTKIIISVIVVAVIGLGTGLVVRYFTGNRPGHEASIKPAKKDFAWGVTTLSFPFPTYDENFMAKQMAETKKLGVNFVRVEYAPNNPKATDTAVEEARKQGLGVVLVVPFGPKDIYKNKTLKKDATDYVTAIVQRYKGRVPVYQLATEVASVALNNYAGAHGIEVKDYPADRLTAVTTWLLAATEAVKTTDPTAKRLVNDQWVHVGFFDNYFTKGGDFDILGWNWFSDMGDSMEVVTIDPAKKQTYELLNKLKAYNKPIWLTEVSRRLGSQGNHEKEQADFITQMALYATKQPAIKGFFVFNLLEDQVAPVKERGYSLVTATSDPKTDKDQKITGRKPAFSAYQQAIRTDQ